MWLECFCKVWCQDTHFGHGVCFVIFEESIHVRRQNQEPNQHQVVYNSKTFSMVFLVSSLYPFRGKKKKKKPEKTLTFEGLRHPTLWLDVFFCFYSSSWFRMNGQHGYSWTILLAEKVKMCVSGARGHRFVPAETSFYIVSTADM